MYGVGLSLLLACTLRQHVEKSKASKLSLANRCLGRGLANGQLPYNLESQRCSFKYWNGAGAIHLIST